MIHLVHYERKEHMVTMGTDKQLLDNDNKQLSVLAHIRQRCLGLLVIGAETEQNTRTDIFSKGFLV